MTVPQSRLATEAKAAISAPLGTQKLYIGERFGGVKALQRGAVLCATLFLMGALQGAAHADDFTWTGATSNDWNTSGNWTRTAGTTRDFPNNAVDTATFPTPVTTNKTPNISASVTVNKLTFNEDGYEVASAAGQTLTLGGTAPIVSVNATSSVFATVSASLSGALTKGGAGILILSGTNTFTTPTISYVQGANASAAINDGAIRLASNGALGGITTINQPTTNTGIQRLELIGNISLGTGVNINTSGRATGVRANSIIVNISGNNSFNGSITISNGGGGYNIYSDTAGDTLTLGALTATLNAGATRAFNMAGAGDIVVNGVISNSTTATPTLVAITKPGTGTPGTGKLTLAGDNTYTGGTTVGTGILQVGNGGGTGTLGTGAVTVTDALVVNRTGTLVVPSVLNGAGTVTVNAGTLQVGSVNTTPFPSLTVNNGGGFAFVPSTLTAGTQTFTLSNLVLTNGSTIGAGLGSTPATSAVINVTSPAKVNGTITVKPFAIPGASPANGDYVQVTDPSGGLLNTNTSTPTYVAASGVNNTSFTVVATDTEVRVTGVVAAAAPVLYWKGGQVPGAGNSWSAKSGQTTNWTTDAAGTQISPVVPTIDTDVFISANGATAQDNMVLGTDFSIKSLTITDSNPVALAAGNTLAIDTAGTTINAGAGAVTLSPVIAGAGGIAKSSSTPLILAGANTYTGTTTIGAGILNIRNATSLGAVAAGTSVANNATLQLQDGITVGAEALTLNGTGAIGQNGSLVNLSGSNVYNGTLTLGSASTISSDAGNLQLAASTSITGAFDLTFTGAGTGEIRNVIATGVGAVNKNGTGTWLVNRASTSPTVSNTYTGGTNVLLGDLTAFGTSSLPLSIGDVSVANGATLRIRDKAATPSVPNNFTISGIGITTGTGATAVSNGAIDFVNSGIASPNGFTGTVTLVGDTLLRIDATQVNIDFRGVISGTGNLTLVKSSGTTTNTKFKFSGANTYAGSTTLGGGLNFELGTGNNIPDASNLIFNAATLRTGGFNETAGTLSVPANSTIDFGASQTSVLNFASSVGTNFDGTLTIINWNGDLTNGASGDQFFVGTSNTGLSASQLANITFTDPAGLPAGSYPARQLASGEVVPFQDVTPPTVVSVTRAAGAINPTSGASVNFTATFSEKVTGVDAADFTVTTTGSITGTPAISVTPVSASVYTVTVSGFSGTGTVRLDVVDDDSIKDIGLNPLGGTGTGNGAFATGETFTITASASSGAIISEFRFRGVATGDQYVELYNTTGAPLNISGWKIRTSTGGAITQDTLVPANTVVPAFGHFLFTGTGYGLTTYGASDTAITTDAANDSGVALFNSAGVSQDAAGFATSPAGLSEGTALASAPNGSSQSAFMRRFKGQLPVDTGDNAADFLLLTTDGAAVTGTSIAPQLGAPNPEGLASPNNINAQIGVRVLDANFGPNVAPNRVRNGSGNGGSLVFRRIIKNNTGQPLSRIRLLVTDITGQVSPVVAGQADVRLTSQADENVAVAGQGTVLVYGTTLEAPSIAPTGTGLTTVGGGGIGSSVNYDIVLTTPLAAGAERPYTFNVQVAKTGSFFININVLGK